MGIGPVASVGFRSGPRVRRRSVGVGIVITDIIHYGYLVNGVIIFDAAAAPALELLLSDGPVIDRCWVVSVVAFISIVVDLVGFTEVDIRWAVAAVI